MPNEVIDIPALVLPLVEAALDDLKPAIKEAVQARLDAILPSIIESVIQKRVFDIVGITLGKKP